MAGSRRRGNTVCLGDCYLRMAGPGVPDSARGCGAAPYLYGQVP